MSSFPSKDEMAGILEKEIDAIEYGERQYIKSKLVPLQTKTLKWEYGNDQEFPAWVIADLQEREVGIAYCLGGHGAYGDKWGLIFLHEDSFGMDAGWYSSLGELVRDGWHKDT